MYLRPLAVLPILFTFSINSNSNDDIGAENQFVPLKDVERQEEQQSSFPDTFHYLNYSLCGDVQTDKFKKCTCNDTTITNVYSSTIAPNYCCVPTGGQQCLIKEDGDGDCPEGEIISKSQLCEDKCYNTYQTSAILWSAHYRCPNRCVNVLSEMCQGIGYCSSDVEACNENIRCYGEGTRYSYLGTIHNITTEWVQDHYYCYIEPTANDGFYNTISRIDESLKSEKIIDVTSLKLCTDKSTGNDGIQCQECLTNEKWCNENSWVYNCTVNKNTFRDDFQIKITFAYLKTSLQNYFGYF